MNISQQIEDLKAEIKKLNEAKKLILIEAGEVHWEGLSKDDQDRYDALYSQCRILYNYESRLMSILGDFQEYKQINLV